MMSYQELTSNQRLNRIFLGAALIVSTMLISTAPLGWIAMIPLFATYPLFAGIYGYDPVTDIARQGVRVASRAFTHVQETVHRSRHV